MSEASQIVTEVVKRGIAPLLKRAGFKKEGLKFSRHRSGVFQLIEFQLSQSNFADQGRFYINVGLGFDTLWANESRGVPARPKVYECHLEKRIEQLIPDTPAHWDVSEATDLDGLAIEHRDRITRLVSVLDRMSSMEAVLQGNWLQVGSELILKSRLFHARGDDQSALTELRAAAAFFAGREGMSLECLVERYHLTSLKLLL